MACKSFIMLPKKKQEQILEDVVNDPTPLRAIANRHNCEFGSLMAYIQKNRIRHKTEPKLGKGKVIEISDFNDQKPVHLTDDEWNKVTKEMLIRAVDHIEAAKILGYSVVETENTWNERGNKAFNLEEYKKNPIKENMQMFNVLHFAISVPEFNRNVWVANNKNNDRDVMKGAITSLWQNKWFDRKDVLVRPNFPASVKKPKGFKVKRKTMLSDLIEDLDKNDDWDTLIELVNDDSNSKEDIAEIFSATVHVLNALLASNAYNRKLEAYMKEHEREEEKDDDTEMNLPVFKTAAEKIAFFEKEIEKAKIEAEIEELDKKKKALLEKLNSMK